MYIVVARLHYNYGCSTNPYAEYLGDKEPYFVLRSTVERIQELTAGLTPEQLAATPEPGKWSIHQIVAHLADCELVFQTRARMIMFQDKPTLVSFDQDPWVLGWMRENEPWDETFERFRVLRRSILRLFLNAERPRPYLVMARTRNAESRRSTTIVEMLGRPRHQSSATD